MRKGHKFVARRREASSDEKEYIEEEAAASRIDGQHRDGNVLDTPLKRALKSS